MFLFSFFMVFISYSLHEYEMINMALLVWGKGIKIQCFKVQRFCLCYSELRCFINNSNHKCEVLYLLFCSFFCLFFCGRFTLCLLQWSIILFLFLFMRAAIAGIIVTRVWTEQLRSWGLMPSKGQEIFLYSITSECWDLLSFLCSGY